MSSMLPIKNLSLYESLLYDVMQQGQQQLYLQYKVCWILHKIVGVPLFSQHYLCMQLPQQFPPKTRSSTLLNFYLPIPP